MVPKMKLLSGLLILCIACGVNARAGDAENALDTLVFQRRDEQIRAFAHALLLTARSRFLQGKDGASRADFIGCNGGYT